MHAVLLQPLPFPEPERLLWVNQQDHSLPGVAPQVLSHPDYFGWRAKPDVRRNGLLYGEYGDPRRGSASARPRRVGLGTGLAGMLYGIRPFDPFTFTAMTGVLLLVSLAATSIPAYRAAQMTT